MSIHAENFNSRILCRDGELPGADFTNSSLNKNV